MSVPLIAGNPTFSSDCPGQERLSQLSSGSLAEADAEILFLHVDSCPICQGLLEEMEAGSQKKLPAPQKAAANKAVPPTQAAQLDKLIKQAQQLGRKGGRPERPSKEVSVDHFWNGVRRCGLFESAEVDALISDIKLDDSSSISKELIRRQKLTGFQARALLKGRWKGLVLGNYEILQKLGQGGMGSVFKARHRRLGRIVCVKVINQAGRKSETMLERFRNEARTIAALSHPSFIVAHDADEAEGVPFLAMEFVSGEDLARHIHENGPLNVRLALDICRQVAEAMQYAHDQGVTHRDLKPHNIMLTRDPESGEHHVKVLDLGLARFDSVLNDDPDASLRAAMTNTGVIMGTVDYMAPEQAIRSRDADARSDIYSLGCTLHYLLTGEPVFGGDTVMARLVAHREQVVPSLESQCFAAMPHLDNVFFRLVAKDPAERYQSMLDVAEDLSLLLQGRIPSIAAQADSGNESSVMQRLHSQKRKRGSYRLWVITGLVFCIACLGVWFQFTRSNRSAPATTASTATAAKESRKPKSTESVFDRVSRPRFNFNNAGTIAAGGNGTALIILPTENADLQHLVAWEEAVKELNVDVMYASSEWAQTTSRTGYEMPHARSVEGIRIDEVDMILFVGGPTQGFNRKVSVNESLKSLLRSAMPQGVVLGSFAGAEYDALDSVVELCREPTRDGLISVTSPFGQSGVYMEIDQPKGKVTRQLESAIALVKAGVEHRRKLAEERNEINLMAFYETLEPRQLRRNWGAGRALVVLPFNGYNERDLSYVRKVFEREGGVELLATSSEWGTPISEKGNRSLGVNVMLDRFSAAHFDYLIFIGGDVSRFAEDSDIQNQLVEVVHSALDNGLVVTSVSTQAHELLKLAGVDAYEDIRRDGKGPVYSGEYRRGHVTVVDRPEQLWRLKNEAISQRDHVLRPKVTP